MWKLLVALPSLAVLVAMVLPAALAGPRDLIVCYPGEQGETKQAQLTMDALAALIGDTAKLDSFSATYFNELAAAERWSQARKPGFRVLSLACYLNWKSHGVALTLVAAGERGKKTTVRYHVLVHGGASSKTLADLKGKTIASRHAADREFVEKVIFDAAPDGKSVKTRLSNRIKSAITQLAGGAPQADLDGVLLSDAEVAFLEEETRERLRIVFTSREVPLAAVVAFAGPTVAEVKSFTEALVGMDANPKAAGLLRAMTCTGFRKPDEEAFARAERDYSRSD